jgi:hypothetical protein
LRSESIALHSLASALDRGQLLASSPTRFNSGEMSSSTNWIRSRMGPEPKLYTDEFFIKTTCKCQQQQQQKKERKKGKEKHITDRD